MQWYHQQFFVLRTQTRLGRGALKDSLPSLSFFALRARTQGLGRGAGTPFDAPSRKLGLTQGKLLVPALTITSHERAERVEWSGCRDSNPGPQRPERCALPTALHPGFRCSIEGFA